MAINGWQFGRYVEVIIKDFNKNVRTVVGNEFEIDFEFLKSVDDSKQNSTGIIRIKGLSEERCESFSERGGEVTLRCGYEDNIETLFTAYIMRMYKEISDNTTLMTIECSMNVQEFFYSSHIASTPNENGTEYRSPLNVMIKNYAENLGYVRVNFYTDSTFSKEEQNLVKEIYNRGIVSFQFEGTANEQLNMMCAAICVSRTNKPTEEGLVLELVAKKGFLDRLGGVEMLSEQESSKYYKDYVDFRGMYVATIDNGFGTLTTLSTTTGLLSTKVEYKIAKAYRDQLLMSDSEETLQSKEKTAKFYENEKKRKHKYDERVAKHNAKNAERKEEGKKELKAVKGFQAKTIRNEIQVRRRYLRVTALLNPKVRPQSPLMVIHKVYNEYGEVELKSDSGRAREVTYKGNNKTGDWIMDIYLETNAENDIELSEEDKAALLRNDETVDQPYSRPPSGGRYNYTKSQGRMTESEVRATLKTPIKADAFRSGSTVDAATVQFAKDLENEYGGEMARFTSFTGGSHASGEFSHANGHKFDLVLNCTSPSCYTDFRQRALEMARRNGLKVKILKEAPEWDSSMGEGFFKGGSARHLDIQVTGLL